jgi:hypothetical protein
MVAVLVVLNQNDTDAVPLSLLASAALMSQVRPSKWTALAI